MSCAADKEAVVKLVPAKPLLVANSIAVISPLLVAAIVIAPSPLVIEIPVPSVKVATAGPEVPPINN